MTRAAFTVHMKPAEGRNDGINYDAVMLNPTFEDHTMRPMLSFVCSGRQMTVPASEVAGVTARHIAASAMSR